MPSRNFVLGAHNKGTTGQPSDNSGIERWDKWDKGLSLLSIIGAGCITPTDANLSANIGTFPEGFCSLSHNLITGLGLGLRHR